VSPLDAPLVLQALVDLNRLEAELKSLSPRSIRRDTLALEIARERPKVPAFILAHHDRIRARGRPSTVQVRDWICRGCFISVPIGLRTKLANHDDICVCENCGSYIYMPTAEQQASQEAFEAKRREAVARAASIQNKKITQALPKSPAQTAKVKPVATRTLKKKTPVEVARPLKAKSTAKSKKAKSVTPAKKKKNRSKS
jgi:hypothetical protein